ncbi:uncharacterized protein LOC126768076 [Bactrocera neohumeralis]|uniref:uncharacterized protein LOC120776066 n=1 Tax=Bactrocera tryoni TaxID=59916 RepID=UPI001A956A68|nr:uncharacterized protein LOC120776066 [Bactrocera tryoni]XP_050341929.1 uncharacterized protein LOC126768076 [Bactrocera neohumeralis]
MSRGSHSTGTLHCCCQKLLLLLWAASALRATLAGPSYRSYGQCTDAETGRELYIGESFTRPGQCIRVQCLGTLQLWEDGCEVPKLEGNCSPVPPGNEFLNYPYCCPLFVCRKIAVSEKDRREEIRTYNQYGTMIKQDIQQIFSVGPVKGNVPGAGVITQFEI